MLTLKGSCYESPVDWVYFIKTDKDQQVFYQGYKTTKIVLVDGHWTILDAAANQAELNVKLIEGYI